MPRPCSVCVRSDRSVIDHAKHGENLSHRAIAARFSIPSSVVDRHFKHATGGTALVPAAKLALVKPAPIAKTAPCKICSSPDRDAIEAALLANASPATIAKSYPKLSEKLIDRHRRSCIPVIIERTRAVVTATNITTRMADLMCECEEFLVTAKGADDRKAQGVALGRLTSAIELLARLSGELSPAGAEDALVRSAQWQKFLKAAIDELTPIPGALAALKRALQRIGA